MQILKPAPVTLSGLSDFLSLGVNAQDTTQAIFDLVAYDSQNEKITIECAKPVCEITIESGNIIIAPIWDPYGSDNTYGLDKRYKDTSSTSYNYRFKAQLDASAVRPFSAMYCKNGFVFYGRYPDFKYSGSTENGYVAIIIARTKTVGDGEPISMFMNAPVNTTIMRNITSNIGYATIGKYETEEGYNSCYSPSVFNFSRQFVNSSSDPAFLTSNMSYSADRTILTPIPIPGKYGSNDFLETAFFRAMDTYEDNGLHIINGKKYGVFGNWAILDE